MNNKNFVYVIVGLLLIAFASAQVQYVEKAPDPIDERCSGGVIVLPPVQEQPALQPIINDASDLPSSDNGYVGVSTKRTWILDYVLDKNGQTFNVYHFQMYKVRGCYSDWTKCHVRNYYDRLKTEQVVN